MKNRQYQGVQLSKKESELIEFLQTGSNDWQKAFYIYKHRRKRKGIADNKQLKERSWFNRTLMRLQLKDIAKNIPFVWDGVAWFNPGIEASKANLVIEQKIEQFQELRHQKPIL